MSISGVPNARAEAESADNRIDLAWTEITAPTMLQRICETIRSRTGRSAVRVVDLIDNKLGPEGVSVLAATLETSAVEELMLRFNAVGKAGCDALSSTVKVNNRLRCVDVRGNDLTGSDVRRLLKAVAESSSVTVLGLGSNRLGPEGAEKVAELLLRNPSIAQLDLSRNEIGPQGAAYLAKPLANNTSAVGGGGLRSLDVFGNAVGPEGARLLFGALESNKALTRLSIGHNALGDVPMSALGELLQSNHTLTDLDLCCNGITVAGLVSVAEGIRASTSLARLVLRDNIFYDDDAREQQLHNFTRAVSLSESLTSLDLGSCGLGSRGVTLLSSALAASSTLTEVDLSYNQADDAAAHSIAEAIVASKRLTVLSLVGNTIGPQGAELLLDALQRNPVVSGLALHGNPSLSRALHKKVESLLLARRSDDYRRGSAQIPPLRRPAKLPFD